MSDVLLLASTFVLLCCAVARLAEHGGWADRVASLLAGGEVGER